MVTDLLDDSTKFLQRTLQGKDESLKEKDDYLENALKEKDEYLDDALKDKDEYIKDALKEKDDYLAITLRDTEEYLQNALKDKDEVIQAMQNSFVFRMLAKLDKLLGKTPRKK